MRSIRLEHERANELLCEVLVQAYSEDESAEEALNDVCTESGQ
jgi:hypothetical protein